MLRIHLEWVQIHAGLALPVLEATRVIPYLPMGWVRNLHKLLQVDAGLKIQISTCWRIYTDDHKYILNLVSQNFFDQFVQIAAHHQEVKLGMTCQNTLIDPDTLDPVSVSKATTSNETLIRRKLIQQDDWKEWELAD